MRSLLNMYDGKRSRSRDVLQRVQPAIHRHDRLAERLQGLHMLEKDLSARVREVVASEDELRDWPVRLRVCWWWSR